MAAHKGHASSRPRCTRSGSSVAAIPVYIDCSCRMAWKQKGTQTLVADLTTLARRDEGYSQESSVRTSVAQPRFEPAISHVRSMRDDSSKVTFGIRMKKKNHNLATTGKSKL
jgi:hypothetical protein